MKFDSLIGQMSCNCTCICPPTAKNCTVDSYTTFLTNSTTSECQRTLCVSLFQCNIENTFANPITNTATLLPATGSAYFPIFAGVLGAIVWIILSYVCWRRYKKPNAPAVVNGGMGSGLSSTKGSNSNSTMNGLSIEKIHSYYETSKSGSSLNDQPKVSAKPLHREFSKKIQNLEVMNIIVEGNSTTSIDSLAMKRRNLEV